LIKSYSNERDLILDNAAGSGTTGIACKNTNRSFILIEKEEKYVNIIKKQLNL
jgi:site-specific DNA-methyltransferase (adenine-specific)